MANPRIETFERLAELYNRGDVDAWLDEIGPEVEFTPDPSFPDVGTFKGAELRRWMHEWASMWGESRLEIDETIDRGPAVTARGRWHLTVADSDRDVPIAGFTFVAWFDDRDRLRSIAAFFDHESALAAAEAGPPA